MKDLSDKIIKSIDSQAIKPVPHWKYAVKKILFWSIAIFMTLLGALALALAFYLVQSIDWSVYHMLGYQNMFIFMISAFPYLFILLLAMFFISAYYLYRQTPKGHKINFSALATILIVLGLIAAFALHMLGINREAYFQMAQMPIYHQMMFTKEKQWSQPEKGLIWGEVLSMGNKNFSLRDASGKNWNVLYDDNTSFDENIYDAQGKNVKIIGQQADTNNFQAKQVQRWDGVMNCNGSRNMMNGNRMMNGRGMMGN